jgi:hypothetical protein
VRLLLQGDGIRDMEFSLLDISLVAITTILVWMLDAR